MPEPSAPPAPARGLGALKSLLLERRIDFGLWVTRVLSLYFALGYFLPLFGNAPQVSYSKCILASAATSALRLHQRKPVIRFTREFGAEILSEDSFHYLGFCLIFLFNSGMLTGVLLPLVLFAVLHFASFSLTMLDALGRNSWWGARMLISLVELQSR